MVTRAPAGLDRRGRKLWRDLVAAHRFGPAQLALVEEACRLADRLDRLHALLSGDRASWDVLTLDSGDVTVVVNSALIEARLHAATLKGLVAELRQGTPAATVTPAKTDRVAALQDEVARRRAQRGA
jgi:hypothetical protein